MTDQPKEPTSFDHYHGDTRGTGWRLVLASLKLDNDAAELVMDEVDCAGCWAAIAKNLEKFVASQLIVMAGTHGSSR